MPDFLLVVECRTPFECEPFRSWILAVSPFEDVPFPEASEEPTSDR